MATNKIEDVITEIEEYITEECKPFPMSKSKIVVDYDRMESMIGELRTKMPGEVKRFQKILENRNAILEDAQNKANAMLDDANANVQKLVSDHEIVQMATAQANDIILDAQQRAEQIVRAAQLEAEQLKEGSLAYVGESLENLQMLVGNTMTTVDNKMRSVMESLQNYYTIIEENKNEIHAMANGAAMEEEEPLPQEPMLEDDIQFADLSYE